MKKILLFLLAIYSIETVLAQDNEVVLPSDSDSRPTTKLSPQVRVLERKKHIPTIRIDVIQQFLNRPQLITEEELESAGYIITNSEQSLLSSKGQQIYVKGLHDDAIIGSKYIILDIGQAYHSPLEGEEDEILAHEAIYLGEATLQNMDELSTLMITTSVREIKLNDRLLPLKKQIAFEDFYPHAPLELENAYIVAVTGDYVLIGKYQIVVINKGSYEQMERGHVLKVFKQSRKHKEITGSEKGTEMTLPRLLVGSLLVFKVFDNVSYALVTESKMPIRVMDVVTAP